MFRRCVVVEELSNLEDPVHEFRTIEARHLKVHVVGDGKEAHGVLVGGWNWWRWLTRFEGNHFLQNIIEFGGERQLIGRELGYSLLNTVHIGLRATRINRGNLMKAPIFRFKQWTSWNSTTRNTSLEERKGDNFFFSYYIPCMETRIFITWLQGATRQAPRAKTKAITEKH